MHGYVQPSHHEGLCIAAHQAMSVGLPVIASPVGEMENSIAASKGGIVVPYGAEAQLAMALAQMVSNPEASARTGTDGQRWVRENYCEDRFVASGRTAIRAASEAIAATTDPIIAA